MVDDPISDRSDIKRRRHIRGAAMERTAVEQFAYARREEEPTMAPPRSEVGAVGWLRANLFSSVTNTILTILGILMVVWIVPPFVHWAFIDAVWVGDGRDDCIATGTGACWAFVDAKFAQFMYGRYPIDERWRVNLTGILLVIGLIPMAIPRVPFKRENAIFLLVVLPIVALILLTGGHFAFPGGFVATLLLIGCLATGLVRGRDDLVAGRVCGKERHRRGDPGGCGLVRVSRSDDQARRTGHAESSRV